jgi:hypothetical protein
LGEAARATVEGRFAERSMVERYERGLMELESKRRKRDKVRRAAGAY